MKKHRLFLIAAVAAALFFGKTSSVKAADLTVCPAGCGYMSIQEAVDAAESGDRIIIAPEVYYENLNIQGKNITLTSTEGATIDGNGYRAVYVANASSLALENLRIQNGYGVYSGNNGGGALKVRTGVNVSISNCEIVNCSSGNYAGGAIYAEGSSTVSVDNTLFSGNSNTAGSTGGAACYLTGTACLTASDCVFQNNSSTGYGGAIYAGGGTRVPTLTNCVFSSNSNGATKDGGAIYLNLTSSDTAINNCSFANHTGSGSRGGAIFHNGACRLVINNSTFAGSKAVQYGGAIYKVGNGALELTDCEFNDNDVTTPLDGGAVYLAASANSKIDRCAFYASTARYGGAIYTNNTTALKITNSLFYDNQATGAFGRGGAINFNSGSNTIVNCTFSDNFAQSQGAVVYNAAGSVANIYNSIMYYSSGSPNTVFDLGTLNITDMIFAGTCSGCNTQTRVSGADPAFVNRAADDYHICPVSFARNNGAVVAGTPAFDIDGQARPNEGVWDIGSDEY